MVLQFKGGVGVPDEVLGVQGQSPKGWHAGGAILSLHEKVRSEERRGDVASIPLVVQRLKVMQESRQIYSIKPRGGRSIQTCCL